MSDYLQPDFYRFNEDSLKLKTFVLSRQITAVHSLLDLGAGSGIIGLELAQVLKPKQLHFVEAQDAFLPYLKQNAKTFYPQAVIHHCTFEEYSGKADLIVCNPPYYLPGHGQPYKSREREIARSFVVGSWQGLYNCIERNMTEEGRAYVILPKEKTILSSASFVPPTLQRLDYQLGDLIVIELF